MILRWVPIFTVSRVINLRNIPNILQQLPNVMQFGNENGNINCSTYMYFLSCNLKVDT
jgi:hypothetical protein